MPRTSSYRRCAAEVVLSCLRAIVVPSPCRHRVRRCRAIMPSSHVPLYCYAAVSSSRAVPVIVGRHYRAAARCAAPFCRLHYRASVPTLELCWNGCANTRSDRRWNMRTPPLTRCWNSCVLTLPLWRCWNRGVLTPPLRRCWNGQSSGFKRFQWFNE